MPVSLHDLTVYRVCYSVLEGDMMVICNTAYDNEPVPVRLQAFLNKEGHIFALRAWIKAGMNRFITMINDSLVHAVPTIDPNYNPNDVITVAVIEEGVGEDIVSSWYGIRFSVLAGLKEWYSQYLPRRPDYMAVLDRLAARAKDHPDI
ncbi:hypothetical protein BO71DRAFT_443540 [Aspergillus ellipticus CBS 707.79]|uniref:Uncharacterized protein n=1 Tax=Aspergillus ellipticus CBS 707.79 TaxID=1448320 RepID=A0A319D092_9EURO|nr:hypothetical protein BO71DRAFT_443540 [Aspergillus ellipticus CBS 707.79]